MNSYCWADIQLPDSIIRVFSLHLHSYDLNSVPGGPGYPVRVCSRLRQGLEVRVPQVEEVSLAIGHSPYPVVVCGDFNEVPLSYAHRVISSGLLDAFQEAGWGLGTSHEGPSPWTRIDYILCSPQLRPHNYQIPIGPASEHYPALCEFDQARTPSRVQE